MKKIIYSELNARQKENYNFHQVAAKLSSKEKMISALEKLKSYYQPSDLPKQMAAFGVSGNKNSGLMDLFSSHPPLDKRIEYLKNL